MRSRTRHGSAGPFTLLPSPPRSHASSCTICRTVLRLLLRCRSRHCLIMFPRTTRRTSQTTSRPRSSATSRISPQASSPPLAAATPTRLCRPAPIARRLTASGFAPSLFPAVANFPKIPQRPQPHNKGKRRWRCSNPHRLHYNLSRRAHRGATWLWVTPPRTISCCCLASRLATRQTVHALFPWVFVVRTRRLQARRAMV